METPDELGMSTTTGSVKAYLCESPLHRQRLVRQTVSCLLEQVFHRGVLHCATGGLVGLDECHECPVSDYHWLHGLALVRSAAGNDGGVLARPDDLNSREVVLAISVMKDMIWEPNACMTSPTQ